MKPDPLATNGPAFQHEPVRRPASLLDGYRGTAVAVLFALVALWPHLTG